MKQKVWNLKVNNNYLKISGSGVIRNIKKNSEKKNSPIVAEITVLDSEIPRILENSPEKIEKSLSEK